MNLKQLEYFMAIAEEHQLTAAAKRLHITQPPLSYELQQLEKELGVRLVNRGPRMAELTDAGKLLYIRAAQIIDATTSATREVKSFGKGSRGTLSIGIISSSGGLFPTPSMRSFAEDYPDVSFELREGNTYEVLDMLERGVVDVGVVRTPFLVGDLECRYAKPENMVAIIPEQMSCGRDPKRVALEDLSGKPLAIYRRFEKVISELMEERGLRLTPSCASDDARTTCVWASRGMGIGLVPESFLSTTRVERASVKVVDCEKLVTRMAVVWRRGRYVSPLVERFVELFEADAQGAGGGEPTGED